MSDTGPFPYDLAGDQICEHRYNRGSCPKCTAPAQDFEEHVYAIEAMARRLSEAASVFREARLMLGGGGPAAPSVVSSGPVAPMSPFPCASCGRGAPEAIGEMVQATACKQCGNHLPGGPVESRPPPTRPPTRTIAGFDGFSAQEDAERQRLLRLNRPEELPAAIKALEAES